MRAAEIQLKPVAARILRTFGYFLPCLFFRFDHQRDDHGVVGIFLFALVNFFEVDIEGPVSDEFNVIEADQANGPLVEPRKSRRDISDRLA